MIWAFWFNFCAYLLERAPEPITLFVAALVELLDGARNLDTCVGKERRTNINPLGPLSCAGSRTGRGFLVRTFSLNSLAAAASASDSGALDRLREAEDDFVGPSSAASPCSAERRRSASSSSESRSSYSL